MMTNHRGARTRRNDNVAPGFLKSFDRLNRNRAGLIAQAGVKGRLSATGLFRRELDLLTNPLQNLHNGFSDLGVERVNDAGDEELDGGAHALKDDPGNGGEFRVNA